MTDKKYIFFDIDGTLFNSEGKVPVSTKKALKMAQAKGHEVFINTGRCRPIIPLELLKLGFDGLVCGTGGYIEYKDKLIFERSFNEEQTNRVLDYSIKYDIPIIMSTSTECVASTTDTAKYIVLLTNGAFKLEDFKSAEDLNKSPLLQSMQPFIIDDDKKNYFKNHPRVSDFIFIESPFTVEEWNEKIGDDINVGKASFKVPDEYSGEITLAASTKSTGIEELLKYLGADMKDSIGVGDGYNDIDMLRGVHLSIAMGNSPDDVKKIADYVTDDINEDGVFNALKHFDLI